MSKVKIALTQMRCLEETDEVGSDEPYVPVFAAQIKKIGGLVNVRAASTTKYGPWQNVDKGDLVHTGLNNGGQQLLPPPNCWGLNGKLQEISRPSDMILRITLTETMMLPPAASVPVCMHNCLLPSPRMSMLV